MKSLEDFSFIKNLKALKFIEELWLFGSRARGDNRDRADIDIAVVCPDATSSNWIRVINIIENADTLLKIDCIRFDTLSGESELRINILKDKKPLYAKQNESKIRKI
jgi:predicted nucleotidyltransferase